MALARNNQATVGALDILVLVLIAPLGRGAGDVGDR